MNVITRSRAPAQANWDIELVTKLFETLEEIDKRDFDVAVMSGWPPGGASVVRPLAQTRHIVCASPQYWMSEGLAQTKDRVVVVCPMDLFVWRG